MEDFRDYRLFSKKKVRRITTCSEAMYHIVYLLLFGEYSLGI
jgi:hypothetical protein